MVGGIRIGRIREVRELELSLDIIPALWLARISKGTTTRICFRLREEERTEKREETEKGMDLIE